MGLKLLKNNMRSNSPDFETLQDIEIACDTSINILNDLLSYEKIEAGLMQLEKTQLHVWPFILQTVKPFLVQVRILSIHQYWLLSYHI